MSQTMLLLLGGLSAMIVAAAAWFMLRETDHDVRVNERMDAARGTWVSTGGPLEERTQRAGVGGALKDVIGTIGRAIMASGILPGKTRMELEQTLAGSGFRGPNAMALFLGSKLMLMLLMPLGGWMLAEWGGMVGLMRLAVIASFAVVGLIAPDFAVRQVRKGYLSRLESGLPDALDLLTICAQAGLSLEPGMVRVAFELRRARPEVAREFDMTVRELEILSDSAVALSNLGKRTGLDSLKRLTATLIQTMQYGTPLSDALRALSNEMRQISLTKFEERAARLPVLLTLPMILFILPCVFIVIGGPAGLQVAKQMSK